MTGAAPPPEEAALPATTPCPGGVAGEFGVRASPAPPEDGVLVPSAADAVAWRGDLGACDATSADGV